MPNAAFPPTQWSMLRSLQTREPAEVQRGLTRLCESYWYPVYAFIRGDGQTAAAAEDLTQEFFLTVVARERFDRTAAEQGRFRSYLLASVKHFLSNQRRHGRAQRRGGGAQALSLDFVSGGDRYRLDPPVTTTPEKLYERNWALWVMERALRELQRESAAAGKAVQFQALQPFLRDDDPPSFASVAARLNLSEGAAKVAAHRLRKRLAEILRAQVTETVSTAEEAEDEMRFIAELLRG